MKKNELIKSMLDNMADDNNTICLNAYSLGLSNMYDQLRIEGKWISVKDKLPIKSKMVLCFLKNCNIRMMHYMLNGKFAEPWTGGIIEVTHWMPLPDPPK